MLGKGLESLIPQKGQGQPNGDQAKPVADTNASAIDPAKELPAQPEEKLLENPTGVVSAQPAQATPSQPQPAQGPLSLKNIFPEKIPNVDVLESVGSVFQIEIEKIKPNPDQPRRNFDEEAIRDLAHSIREFGFLQPLVVSRVERETAGGIEVEYQLIAGERRYRAARLLGLMFVPAIIRKVGLEREKLELAVIENIQRENLNSIETARAFQRLQEEFRMTQREIASKLGKSRESVANTMRLLDLPEYIQVAIQKGELSESHGRLLLGVADPAAQKNLFEDITVRHLTIRDAKDRVEQTKTIDPALGGAPRRGRPPLSEAHLSPELKAAQESLSMDLGAPVEIHKNANNGKITITFFSEEELENILRRLGEKEH